MSRWLTNVNKLLNQLDGQVENVATNASTVPEVSSAATVDAILNKRGFSNVVEQGITNDNEKEDEGYENNTVVKEENLKEGVFNDNEEEEVIFEETIEFNEIITEKEEFNIKEIEKDEPTSDKSNTIDDTSSMIVDESEVDASVEHCSVKKNVEEEEEVKTIEVLNEVTISSSEENNVSSIGKVTAAAPASSSSSKNNELNVNVTAPPTSTSSKSKEITNNNENNNNSSKKEIRKLHHTIIELNKDLEITETELQALRNELERTGIRIEKDRIRYKEEKVQIQQSHKQELQETKLQHKELLDDITAQHTNQINTLMKQIKDLEDGRLKESGDYKNELSLALQREQECTKKNFMLEEEKVTLQSRVTMIESQNKALDGRLEQVTQTCSSALDREQDIEEKMDSMLNLHAKLINQRQLREGELERTITDLGAALVVAKKAQEQYKSTTTTTTSNNESNNNNNTQALIEELETLRAQHMIESQHCKTLKQEIQDITNERTDEIAQSISKQRQFDRKNTDLNNTITKLQLKIQEYEKRIKLKEDAMQNNKESNHEHKKLIVQIQSLSEQILRQQMKLDLNSSEVSTLKSRLQVALARADNAEYKVSMMTSMMESSGYDNNSGMSDVEKGYISSNNNAPLSSSNSGYGSSNISAVSRNIVRRRKKKGESIRSAFKLQHGDKKVGKAIDVLDKFAMEAGKYLRYNAMARVFHVHNFENVHGDFGSLVHPNHNNYNNHPVLSKVITKNVTKLAAAAGSKGN